MTLSQDGPLGDSGRPADAPVDRAAIPLDHEHSPLWDELHRLVEDEAAGDLTLLREELQRSAWRQTPAGEALARSLERSDAAELTVLAQRLGREWLAAG